ncbi:acetate/propionate family kinase [Lentibacter sp. XHP0401]|uniref:acetate/propionate family kinase n=1 Tax=Lentibacter sp. XHP0401 TaxID=2984334 RepID=UPI0021E82DE8|nr:acetate/propionate family kinase [Lentibacter sp. XHP0401]MCV2891902.1 acetate/propionate family kinase [Lentibacter sp. XHP0401]
MNSAFLTFNAGSSSLKFAVFDGGETALEPRLKGLIAGLGGGVPAFSAKDATGVPLDAGALGALGAASDHEAVIALLLPWLAAQLGDVPLLAVGHRVVHGGQYYAGPTRVTPEVITRLAGLEPLAPLHQPHNVAAIRAVAKWQPDTPQIACFDTSFHRTQDRLAQLFALPRDLSDEGILRYGFHGLSYDYIAGALPEHLGVQADGRVIVAHLGNGSSMCAMKDRKSRATTMGFTALDGLMMGRRCGALDPGVVLYLMQEKGMSANEVAELLYKQSGLLGVSELSNDMQVLQASDSPHAKEAIALFCYRAASSLAGLLPAIGGLDALVFTAGIGENSALVRKLICEQLAWLGIVLDDAANEAGQSTISAASSKLRVLVIPTNEERVVADASRALIA